MAITTPLHPQTLAERFQEAVTKQSSSPKEAIAEYQELIPIAIEEKNYKVYVDCQISLGRIYMEQGFAYKALHFTGTALQIINHHFPDDKNLLALCYKELGVIYADGLKKYSIAFNYFFKALHCNVSSLTVALYNNIGSVYKDSGKYDEAIKYLGLGQALIKDPTDLFNVFILENLGATYLLQNDFQAAETTLLKALSISSTIINSNHSNASAYYIRGFVLNRLGELYLKTKRQKLAMPLINEALEVATNHNHQIVIIESLKNRSSYALLQNDNELFLTSINKAIEYCENENLINEGESCLQLLKDYHWSHGNYREACIIADKIIAYNTKIKETHESNSMSELLEQRESEIVLLEEDNRSINREKEDLKQFAFIVAHDLKEPLRSIGSYSGILKRKYASIIDKEGLEFLDFVINSSSHMYQMLEDLLKYATLNEQDNAIGMTLPKPILDNITYQLKDKINELGAQVIYEDIPPVFIRSTHLSVLLDNLIKNALKFRQPGRKPVVHIAVKEEKNQFCFIVKDNGKGIHPQYFEKIFQIFKRLDKNPNSGTGIGLSICKKIVESYNGRIWVESEEGAGATFYFTLPKARPVV
jgi:signal transduction histidine kinase/Tfp pilus assembly protein PilF